VLVNNRLDVSLEYVMDYEFWLRLGRNFEFRHVDDVLAGDRNHAARKILNQREAMQAEASKIAAKYGAASGMKHTLGRATDIFASGIPRRIDAIVRTIQLHHTPPELAFDGQLCSLNEMLSNIFRSNRTLV
jgi:molybdopterin-biosynthesis enzyme MoeA-like protein